MKGIVIGLLLAILSGVVVGPLSAYNYGLVLPLGGVFAGGIVFGIAVRGVAR